MAWNKNMALAYVLLILFGGLAIHRFYLRRTWSAVVMLALTLLALIMPALVVRGLLTGGILIWLIVDLFLIPGMVRNAPANLR